MLLRVFGTAAAWFADVVFDASQWRVLAHASEGNVRTFQTRSGLCMTAKTNGSQTVYAFHTDSVDVLLASGIQVVSIEPRAVDRRRPEVAWLSSSAPARLLTQR